MSFFQFEALNWLMHKAQNIFESFTQQPKKIVMLSLQKTTILQQLKTLFAVIAT